MHKFNEVSIVSNVIKSILKAENIPSFRVFKPGMFVIKNAIYIYEHTLYQAKLSGFCESIYNSDYFSSLVAGYLDNEFLLNETKTFYNNSNYYDSETHEYLGKYLRYLRDFKNLDLMSMYNCYSNRICNNLKYEILNKNNVVCKFDTKDKNYNIFMIPICSEHTYTIAIDNPLKTQMFAGYFDTKLLYEDVANYSITYQEIDGASFYQPLIYDKMDVKNLDENNFYNNRNTYLLKDDLLYLFVKVPSNIKTSIVVLEGNYLNSDNLTNTYISGQIGFNADTTFDETEHAQNITKFPIISPYYFQYLVPGNSLNDITLNSDGLGSDASIQKTLLGSVYLLNENTNKYELSTYDYIDQKNGNEILNEILASINKYPALLRYNTGESYPFSNRLVEYLFLNAITRNDKIIENIVSVQENLFLRDQDENRLKNINVRGQWDSNLTKCLYDIILYNNLNDLNPDMIGYVDKDLEKFIELK